MQADISRLRIVAISLSKSGICPILANSSSKQRTWCFNFPLPSGLLSAFVQSKLNIWVYNIATRKLKVASVSEMMMKRAVFRSPILSSCISSYAVISKTELIEKQESLAEHEIKMDFAVLPAASLYALYCFTAKLPIDICSFVGDISRIASNSPRFSSSSSCWFNHFSTMENWMSIAFWNVSSSSRHSEQLIMSISVAKFHSSGGETVYIMAM